MIPLNITDEVVLRRTLEEIEASIPKLEYSLTPIGALEEGATIEEVTFTVNEIVLSLNALINTFNNN